MTHDPGGKVRIPIVTPIDAVPSGAEWRVIEEWPAYEVSEYGHVRRIDGSPKSHAISLNRPWRDGRYFRYRLYRDAVARNARAHALVCAAFNGPRPSSDHHVAHWDDNPLNCSRGNLRWATRVENAADAKRNGCVRPPRGEGHGNSKLTAADVATIRASRESQRRLAGRFGVCPTTIFNAQTMKTWRAGASDDGA